MATDFGFYPSENSDAYFVSYNTEDSDRVAPIVRKMSNNGVPLWYDYGLEYGEEWERQIAEHIAKCKAVIMFITKKLFQRERRSFVYKEYRMAKMCEKKVYVVKMDNIPESMVKSIVPKDLWSWWFDLDDLHCITCATADEIMSVIGFKAVPTVTASKSLSTGMTSASELNKRGDDYYYGKNGVPQDYEQAVKYYKLAADQGYASAQCNLGFCYTNGQGVPQDYEQAVKYYKLAADQGYASAQCNLGFCYECGRGVPQDYEQAVKYYKLAVDQGNARAQCNLGFCYTNGQGVPQDYEQAVKYYKLAADQGYATAQYNLGVSYEYGQGVPQDYEQAVKYYKLAADQGDADAREELKRLGIK